MRTELIYDAATRAKWATLLRAVDAEDCIEWRGCLGKHGYGAVNVLTTVGRVSTAHRLAYLLTHGDLDPALVVRHTCHNRRCINPRHLTVGTRADNSNDMVVAGRASKGEARHNARLTAHTARQIRREYPALEPMLGKPRALQSLADQHGVDRATISKVLTGQTWRHVSAAD